MARIVPSVARAIDALDALADAPDGLTLAALSRRLRVPKSTLHAILGTLSRRSMVEFLSDRAGYRLGPKLAELGVTAGGQRQLVETAYPFLERLVRDTGESCFLGVPAADPMETIYVGKVESPHAIRYSADLGERRPSHATAAGKMLLASLSDGALRALLRGRALPRFTPRTITDPAALLRDLRRIRARGFALTVDERIVGASGIAALIRYAPGRVAALSVIGPTGRIRARLRHHIPLLLRAVRGIEAAMGQASSAPGAPPHGSRRRATIPGAGRACPGDGTPPTQARAATSRGAGPRRRA